MMFDMLFEDMLSLLAQKIYFSLVLLLWLCVPSELSGLALRSSAINNETLSVGNAILSHELPALAVLRRRQGQRRR